MENSTPDIQRIKDESPFNLPKLRKYFPAWLRNFLPIGGGHHHREEEKTLFGFLAFLISESFIFAVFIISYIALRATAETWIPPGVKGPEMSAQTLLSSIILLSSSIVIYFAERALKKRKIARFRLLWLMTVLMGAFFLYAEVKEWLGNDFSPSTGLLGSTYYLLTGFHGLHVAVGIILLTAMLIRSFIPRIYQKGHYGVTAISLFWHFVDVLWIVLFSLIYLWRG
ncbi:heme-copper oxidase subunit III [Oscillatoria sp. FACHB-1406]|uniref:cytochrome c oxidase subunit 3 n=1 Tax=Oscillatoria sp. FACHB-1406 TaxID=2692846 RepID=UPI0016851E1B|nr:heme-copper oxidase subunit III [Oscillatoria sp. FACHB-1406]MBD2576729.1 heme-copper oxidase subunit III [Oscillatoria sp. FACHB-1406]